jgi:hypothetical protein
MTTKTHKFGRLLSRILRGTLQRMAVPYRDSSSDYYRFPWF